ncbi:cytochrome b [Morganella morganii]
MHKIPEATGENPGTSVLKKFLLLIKKIIKLPKSARTLWVFGTGAILLVMLTIQVVTGLILAMYYVPTAEQAFDSVINIIRNINNGELIRNLHTIGASLFFIACYIHIFRGMYYSVYRRPFIKMWMISVTLYLLLIITAFLGYSLIWGQKSYWAATVMTELSKAIPFVGESVHSFIVGGFSVGTPMLGRFYVLHFLIPLIIIIFTVIHIRSVQLAFSKAVNKPFTDNQQRKLLFNYEITNEDAIKVVLFLFVLTWFVFFTPQSLMHADNFIKADPAVTPEIVSPEWYFLTLFSILRCFPDELAGITAMFGAVFVFYLLPWLDRSKSKFRNYNIYLKIIFFIWIGNAIFLGWLGSQALSGPDLINWLTDKDTGWVRPASQLSTVIYFSYFFIVLPCRKFIEKQD